MRYEVVYDVFNAAMPCSLLGLLAALAALAGGNSSGNNSSSSNCSSASNNAAGTLNTPRSRLFLQPLFILSALTYRVAMFTGIYLL